MFFCLKIITITQLNFLFVFCFWSAKCRCLIKLLMKWVQFINNYQKYTTLGGTMKKQFVLQSCFLYVLPRHTSIMTDKWFNLFDECASRYADLVYIFSLRKKSAPLLPEEIVKCTHMAA